MRRACWRWRPRQRELFWTREIRGELPILLKIVSARLPFDCAQDRLHQHARRMRYRETRVERRASNGLICNVAKTKKPRLTLLGRSEVKLPASPAEARLETFPNPARRNYRIHFETDDFTAVCPITGQPDFARIDIDYVPDRLCIESKSLKFYLASYRNERAFNEAVTNRILDDFVKACEPREAIVTAQFSARGGIALIVRAEYPDKRRNNRDGR